jgi:hypothetical protein
VAQLNLHPCAVQMTWVSDGPLTGGEWETILRNFFTSLGENCITGGGELIGHIKAIATVAGLPCLQLSLVSVNQAVNVDGSLPDATNELGITLNVLVFGMSADDVLSAFRKSRNQAAALWHGAIDFEWLPAAQEYPVVLHG